MPTRHETADEPCIDQEVRAFMMLAGWDVTDKTAVEKHADAWRYLRDRLTRRQDAQARHKALMIALMSAILGLMMSILGPVLLGYLRGHLGL